MAEYYKVKDEYRGADDLSGKSVRSVRHRKCENRAAEGAPAGRKINRHHPVETDNPKTQILLYPIIFHLAFSRFVWYIYVVVSQTLG